MRITQRLTEQHYEMTRTSQGTTDYKPPLLREAQQRLGDEREKEHADEWKDEQQPQEDNTLSRRENLLNKLDYAAATTHRMLDKYPTKPLPTSTAAERRGTFKMGIAKTVYSRYVNHYHIDDLALSPAERTERKQRENALSRKFSISEDGLFYVSF